MATDSAQRDPSAALRMDQATLDKVTATATDEQSRARAAEVANTTDIAGPAWSVQLLAAASQVEKLEGLLQRLEKVAHAADATDSAAAAPNRGYGPPSATGTPPPQSITPVPAAAALLHAASLSAFPVVHASPTAAAAAPAPSSEQALLARIAALEAQNRALQASADSLRSAAAAQQQSSSPSDAGLHRSLRPPTHPGAHIHAGGGVGGGEHITDSPTGSPGGGGGGGDPAPGNLSLYAKRSTRSASVEIQLFEAHMAQEQAKVAAAAAAASATTCTSAPASISPSPATTPLSPVTQTRANILPSLLSASRRGSAANNTASGATHQQLAQPESPVWTFQHQPVGGSAAAAEPPSMRLLPAASLPTGSQQAPGSASTTLAQPQSHPPPQPLPPRSRHLMPRTSSVLEDGAEEAARKELAHSRHHSLVEGGSTPLPGECGPGDICVRDPQTGEAKPVAAVSTLAPAAGVAVGTATGATSDPTFPLPYTDQTAVLRDNLLAPPVPASCAATNPPLNSSSAPAVAPAAAVAEPHPCHHVGSIHTMLPTASAPKKASFRLLRADSRQCEYSNVGNGRISLGVRSTNLVRLNWAPSSESQPRNVLIIKKPGDAEVSQALYEIALWLHAHSKVVWVEPAVKIEDTAGISSLPFLESWSTPAALASLHLQIDLVICLGGDGTLLWASNLFKTSVPPVISFALGSLGFLSPFPLDSFPEALTKVFAGGFHLTLRSRLVCTIVKGRGSRAHPPTRTKRASIVRAEAQAAAGAAGHGAGHGDDSAAVASHGPLVRGITDPIVSGASTPAVAGGRPLESIAVAGGASATPPSASASNRNASNDGTEALSPSDLRAPSLSIVKARHYSLSAQGFNSLTQGIVLGTQAAPAAGSSAAAAGQSLPVPSNAPSAFASASSSASPHIQAHARFGGAQGVGVELVDEEHHERDGTGAITTSIEDPAFHAAAAAGAATAGQSRRASPSPATAAAFDDVDAFSADDVESYVCMNEVIIDRGLSAYLTNLDCYVDGMLFTRVQADGIIVATPTGSTAYSLSAGGSMCHPEVPCMLFTPVCPHSLSFRPLLFPDTSTLQIKINSESRGNNCASFDGRHRATLNPGDSLLISMSRWPLPSICRVDGTTDWFDGVRSVLQWNSRSASQKSFNPNAAAAAANTSSTAAAIAAAAAKRVAATPAAAATHHLASYPSSSASSGVSSPPSVLASPAASGTLLASPHPQLAQRLATALPAAPAIEEQHSHSAPPARDTPQPQA